jgi:DNA-binding MarR family transcriptional regulator
MSHDLGACACSQIRRTARKISLLYDAILSPAGLTVTQYALLVNVERLGAVSHTALSTHLGMERTTLTRNLRPLITAKLIATAPGEDRRAHLLRLTPTGRRKLQRSVPLWEEAQRRFISQMGAQPLKELESLLVSAESAAARAGL